METSGEVGQLVEAHRQAQPGRAAMREQKAGTVPSPLSRTSNLQLVRPIANGHVRIAGMRVLERIRQAFLDDAIGGEVNPSREGRAIPARASGTCR
jgi:hypothetical protein